MKNILLVFTLSMLAIGCSQQQEQETVNTSSSSDEIANIKAVLNTQAAHWNDGDIEGYMQGYWNNDSLLFIGRGGPGYGYQNTLERYKKGYPDKAAMGHLTFSELSFNRLSSDYYHVIGKYQLARDSNDASGYFTLLFRKINGEWVIVADHSS